MFLRLTSSSFVLTLAAAPAFALTPDEVWTSWIKYYASMGYTATEGARDLAGETLTVKDAAFTHDQDGSKVVITLPQVVMQSTGDGGVRTTMPSDMKVAIDSAAEEGKAKIAITIAQPGAEILSTGDATKRTDVTKAATATITVDSFQMDDDPALTKPVVLNLTNLTSQTVTEGDKTIAMDSTIGKVDYTLDITADGSTVKGSGSVADLSGNGLLSLPTAGTLSMDKMTAEVLSSGGAVNGSFKFGANNADISYSGKPEEGEGSTGTMTAKVQGGSVGFKLGKDGIGYQGSATGIEASLTDSQLPVPVNYKLDSASFDMAAPLLKGDAPQPFKLVYKIAGLTLNDEVWALFDPSKKLPRTPVNFDVDVSGQAKVVEDVFAMAKAAAPEKPAAGEAPAAGTDAAKAPAAEGSAAGTATDGTKDAAKGEDESAGEGDDAAAAFPWVPTAATINRIALEVAGAKVAATGQLTFPEGQDMPVGKIDATAEGVNALIDNLVAMGLVSQDQVQGYRMMLAMVAKPVEGKDALTSAIELKEGGQVFANGQQIK